jgi:hypothetical protein
MKAQKVAPSLFVAGGDAPGLLQLVEAPDVVAFAVDSDPPVVALLSIGLVGDVGDGALALDVRSRPIGVIALIGDDSGATPEAIE